MASSLLRIEYFSYKSFSHVGQFAGNVWESASEPHDAFATTNDYASIVEHLTSLFPFLAGKVVRARAFKQVIVPRRYNFSGGHAVDPPQLQAAFIFYWL